MRQLNQFFFFFLMLNFVCSSYIVLGNSDTFLIGFVFPLDFFCSVLLSDLTLFYFILFFNFNMDDQAQGRN